MISYQSIEKLREKAVQSKAEQIYEESGGSYGTPPGIPLMEYDEMCKLKGLNELSAVARYSKSRQHENSDWL